MPVIYYSKYIPISDSVREVNEQEHRLGRELLTEALPAVRRLVRSLSGSGRRKSPLRKTESPVSRHTLRFIIISVTVTALWSAPWMMNRSVWTPKKPDILPKY